MTVASFFSTQHEQSLKSGAAKYNDLFVVAGLAAIITLMILPLPLFLIDVLVAVNITFACMLLLSAVYISSVVEFSVFPSLLLISTLFRLALSVATTRLILLQADAGAIIDTFGLLVAGGNIVVGLVVFLIITVVQFIVIAKGAERVAEVAARFSLDGMPGKQLSIDSDLRSGIISKAEAREKRRLLELESKLHGNLDGAMKFVKGDAIASIIIIIINLLGGLAVGVLQRGMEVGSAMSTYSILTIGDGLVAQLPALLSAMAAGLIVTRTTGEKKETHLGDAISDQFASRPRVFLVTAGGCFLMALVPGFPSAVFVLLGGAALVLGFMLTPGLRAIAGKAAAPLAGPLAIATRGEAAKGAALAEPRIETSPTNALVPIVPLMLEVDRRLLSDESLAVLRARTGEILREAQFDLGVALPSVAIHAVDFKPGRNGETSSWRVLFYEAPEASGGVSARQGAIDEITAGFSRALYKHAGLFVGIQETNALLTAAGANYPDVVQEIARALPVPQIAAVFRQLVDEQVPIRDIRALLEALAAAAPKAPSLNDQAEAARIALARHITYKYAPEGVLSVYRLAPAFEEALRASLQVRDGAPEFALPPEEIGLIGDAVRAALALDDSANDAGSRRVLLTFIDLRRPLWRLLNPMIDDIDVLSFNEITPGVTIREIAEVAVPPSLNKAPEASLSGDQHAHQMLAAE